MAILIPVAGGKGGVGKSLISLNISVTLAKKCKRVVLVDLDLGGSNLHTLLGLKNNQAGIGNFIHKMETSISNLQQATGIPGLQFIAGDCLLPGAANMDYFTKLKLIKELNNLDCDYVVLDLGAGSSYNVVDFYLTVPNGIVVITPELTSVLNAYSFLKAVIFRYCYRSFSPKSAERQILKNSVLSRLEGKDYSFEQILQVISNSIPGAGEKVFESLQKIRPRIIMNMGRSEQDVTMGERLKNLAKSKLSVNLDFIGFVPYDETVQFSVAQRKPNAELYPDSPFTSVLDGIAQRIISTGDNQELNLHDDPDDLQDIIKEYYENRES